MSRKSVFIVDDHLDIREVLAETLMEKGFDVTSAPQWSGGPERLTALEGPCRLHPLVGDHPYGWR